MTDAYFFNADSPEEVRKRVDEFIHRCEMIARHVFHKNESDVRAFKEWITSLASSADNPFVFLNDTPLYLVAEYLGTDMRFIDSSGYSAEYDKLARSMNWS
jgi:hypothetical protein